MSIRRRGGAAVGGLGAVLLAIWIAGVSRAEGPAATVQQFTPQGTVKKVRQVMARFSEPIVPLGDPRGAKSPFDVRCGEKGSGRWIDSKTWSFDFERDLPAGVRCRFAVREDLTTLAGGPIGGAHAFEFSTGGPSIVSSIPYQGAQAIDEQQAFILFLDAPADAASVVAHASFAVEGLPARVEARLVEGERRAAIAKSVGRKANEPNLLVIEGKQSFPNGAKVSLVWGKGITTQGKSKVATDRDQTLPFVVRPTFTASFHCTRERPKAPCIPVSEMTIDLAAPVASELAKKVVLTGPQGFRRSPEAPANPDPLVSRIVFAPPFPEDTTFKVELPADVKDEGGRPLVNADRFPLEVKTSGFPPLAKFAARFGIVEWKGDATLPVTLRNVEPALAVRSADVATKPVTLGTRVSSLLDRVRGKVTRLAPEERDQILPWLHRVELARRHRSLFAAPGSTDLAKPSREFQLPKPGGGRPFEVVGIPFQAPGLYVVELESKRLGASLLGKDEPFYVPTAALVTNLSIHFKWGRESSLAWVTALDAGTPVANASVAVQDCKGKVLWEGPTDASGIARIRGLPERETLPDCPDERSDEERRDDAFTDSQQSEALASLRNGLFVTARTSDDLSFVSSGWDQGIEAWRYQLPDERWEGPTVAHTIFDRPLFRAGETVHMKHVLRAQVLAGFAQVPTEKRPGTVSIRHLGSDEKFDQPLSWDASGIAETTWKIPKEAKLGAYQVVLVLGDREWSAGEIRVEEFRVPLMRAVVKPPAEAQIGVDAMSLDLSVQYLAGGGAGGLPVVVRWQVRERGSPEFEDFEGFTFANGGVKEGIERRSHQEEETDEATPDASGAGPKPKVERRELALDATGGARTEIRELPRTDALREVLTELEYRDPNGRTQTSSATTPLWPSRWLVGVRPDSWLTAEDRMKTTIAVVDTSGKAVGGARVEVSVLEQKLYSNRTRLIGGFYSYEGVTETKRVGPLCSGTTDARGTLLCEGKPPARGNLVLQASVADPEGRTSIAHEEVWVPASSQQWFRVGDSDRIDLIPEKKRYEPGEKAKLQVRMPFPKASALVSVEREGVLEAWVQTLSGAEPVVEVPVQAGYAPNIFVSVMAVRGRVTEPAPTALVDLGKPAFKLGIAEIRVGWRAFELKVAVSTDKSAYHVRDKATVEVRATTADGKPPPAGSEVAIAAVDEGLLDLLPNRSWNLLDAMMGRRGYEIRNATAQGQVVGKRHYGLKALPQGGGGGRGVTRELFDTLLLWKGRVPLDAAGHARVEVPLNDSLTSFRIVAVATSGADLFGTGATSIRSTQDLMLLSGIAPLVREGDAIRSEITARNTSDHAMDVSVKATVEGLAGPLEARQLALAPGEAKTVDWPITVPAGVTALSYRVDADAAGTADHLKIEQRVIPVVADRTLQATLVRVEGDTTQTVEMPKDALPGRGGVRVALAPRLTTSLEGVREWMSAYPYGCMEQRVSRAIALRDESMWKAVTGAMPSYADADGLLKYFPTQSEGSEVLSAYVLSISHAAGLALPESVETSLVDGLRKFVDGTIRRRSSLPTADLSIRKLAALAALARAGKGDAKLVSSITLEPNLWPTSALLDWWEILAKVEVDGRAARSAEVEQILRSRLTLQGTTMGFSTERSDGLWWLMESTDANALKLVLALVERKLWTEDLPRILQGAIARQSHGAWCCTVANAWGTVAVERFAAAFEAAPVDGTTRATLGADSQALAWKDAPTGGPLVFAWPKEASPLRIAHDGKGTPWATIQLRAAVPLRAPLASGYRFTRAVTPVEQKVKGRWSRGDVLKVRLEIDAQSDMTWVVVDDPLPAGASHLGTGLGGDWVLAQPTEPNPEREAVLWPAFEERAESAFRAYFDFVPKGRFVVEHTIRLNQSGRFAMPTTRVEALYAPEAFGEAPNDAIEVDP